VLLAIAAPTVIGALSFFYSILSVCLFVPVVAGLYARRVGAPEAWAAIGAGALALLTARLAGRDYAWIGFTPAFLGLLASAAACLAVRFGRRPTTQASARP
jgi:solute:Na+ symporter, SSS family